MREIETRHEVERIRREALSPQERLKEDSQELRQNIQSNPEIVAVLYRHPSGPNVVPKTTAFISKEIATTVLLSPIDTAFVYMAWKTQTALIPSKFKMDGAPGSWPLMVEKWFQHRRHINLDKIAAYIDEQDAYIAASIESSEKDIVRQLSHTQGCSDKERSERDYKCPSRPTFPSKPRLKNYTTEERVAYDLGDVLKHRGCRYVDSLWGAPLEESESEPEAEPNQQVRS